MIVGFSVCGLTRCHLLKLRSWKFVANTVIREYFLGLCSGFMLACYWLLVCLRCALYTSLNLYCERHPLIIKQLVYNS